jgi:hypothetical protein
VWRYASHDRFWKRTYRYWLLFAFSGTFILSFQELFSKTRVVKLEMNNITDFYIASDDAFNPIVKLKFKNINFKQYLGIADRCSSSYHVQLGELVSLLI